MHDAQYDKTCPGYALFFKQGETALTGTCENVPVSWAVCDLVVGLLSRALRNTGFLV